MWLVTIERKQMIYVVKYSTISEATCENKEQNYPYWQGRLTCLIYVWFILSYAKQNFPSGFRLHENVWSSTNEIQPDVHQKTNKVKDSGA